jgi:hypothetical protein
VDLRAVSFWHAAPQASTADTFAGGVASLGDVWAASRDAAIYVDNSYATEAAMEKAYDMRNAEIFRALGVKLENPYRASPEELARSEEERRFSGTFGFKRWRDGLERQWQAQAAEAAARIPDRNEADRLARPVAADALGVARAAEERLATLAGSRGGAGGFLAEIGGGIAGSLRDPLQVGTLFLGAGPGAGRTIAGRILSAAAREAFVNGAVEAGLQPMVQAWRERAGLDAGMEAALRNVAFATVFGGAFGGALQGGAEIFARLTGRTLDAAGAAAASLPQVAPDLSRAMNGDVEAARASLPAIREALPAAARGALDHAETLAHLDETRPAAAAATRHDELVTAAHRAADEARHPGFTPDEAQIARIVEAIVGPEAETRPAGRSLVEFLADRGVIDHAGELRAIGAQDLAKRKRGKTDRRWTLDYAREAAEEAGYIGRAGETQTTSVADLLAAIDQEMRGAKIYAREDLADVEAAAMAGAEQRRARAGVESIVAEIQSYAGPAVDDAVIRAAAELAVRDGMDPGDALERVLMKLERDAPSTPAGGRAQAAPGWSDAELEAASAARGDPPGIHGGREDPAQFDEATARPAGEDEAGDLGDVLVPNDAGELVPLSAYEAELARMDDAAFMLENCTL